MSLLKPTRCFCKITDVDLNWLKSLKITTILVDVDNTISPPDENIFFDGFVDWLSQVKMHKIDVIIVSNNHKKRVEAVAAVLGIKFVSLSLKPLTFKVERFLRKIHIKKSETLIIGDQIFSDVLFANMFGIKSILLEPQAADRNKLSIKIKRKFEHIVKKCWDNDQNAKVSVQKN